MLKDGYEGVSDVANRINLILGWSATSSTIDNFE